jgi:hypothetical protein
MRTLCLVLLSAGVVLGSSLHCTESTPPVETPLVVPPPRCVELEAKMVECAQVAAGVESLPPSVENGLREAAGINCRRLRSASRDHELPARIAAACSPQDCAAFAGCVAREAEAAGIFLAARETPPPPPPAEDPNGAGEGDMTEFGGTMAPHPCRPFVDKMLACSEESLGTPLDPGLAQAAGAAYEDACVQLGLSTEVLHGALNACADVPCTEYPGCFSNYLGFGEGL